MKTKILSVFLTSVVSVFAASPYEEYREKTSKYDFPAISERNYVVAVSGLSIAEFRALPKEKKAEVNSRALKTYDFILNNPKLPFNPSNDELYQCSARKFLWVVLNDANGKVYYRLGSNVVMKDLLEQTKNLLSVVKNRTDETPENVSLVNFYLELNAFYEALKLFETRAFKPEHEKTIVSFIQKHLKN